jgi:hypothetical protein
MRQKVGCKIEGMAENNDPKVDQGYCSFKDIPLSPHPFDYLSVESLGY